MRTWRLGLLLFASLPALACGGGGSSSDNGNGNGDNPGSTTLRGGERIGWDQPVAAPEDAGAYSFAVYVDGVPRPLIDARCADVRSAGGVACSGRLPSMASGRHTLELTAWVNGFESPRSSPLSVMVASTALQAGPASSGTTISGTAPAAFGTVCFDAGSMDCYASQRMASALPDVTSLVTTQSGLFFVEEGKRVRVMAGDTLEPSPALTMDDSARITALAVPPDFERSHEVFVAWSEPSRDGGETLNVTRYRELLGVFGEGATIVTGLPLPTEGDAPIAIDADGLVYVALPGARVQDGAPDAAAMSHVILRFSSDGSVPAANPQASPVIAQGYARPSSLVWDSIARQLWLSGVDPRWGPVSTLRVEGENLGEWPWLPSPATPPSPDSAEVPALSLTAGSGPDESRHIWLLRGARRPERAVVEPGRRTLLKFSSVGIPAMGQIADVAAGADGTLVLITRLGSSRLSDVWRLTPLRAPVMNESGAR